MAATNLVNDLDLEVTGPSGTFLGNVLSGGVSVTGGSPDRLNVEEEVLIETPTAGTYTITIRSINIPEGPQPFAVVANLTVVTLPTFPLLMPSVGHCNSRKTNPQNRNCIKL